MPRHSPYPRGYPTSSTSRSNVKPAISLGHPNPLALHPVEYQISSTRQVSASFSSQGPPSCLPVVATTSLTVSTTHGELPISQAMMAPPKRKVTPGNIPSPKVSTATSYDTAMATGGQRDENVSPKDSTSGLCHKHKDSIDIVAAKLQAKSQPQYLATLAKSSTLGSISNMKASFSRNSLSKFTRSTSNSSTVDSEPITSLISTASHTKPGVDIGNPQEIHAAQLSPYWTGRFMALQDRYRNEVLQPESMTTIVNAHAERPVAPESKSQKSTYLTPSDSSSTTSHSVGKDGSHGSSMPTAPRRIQQLARGSLNATRLEDDTNRARRAFDHLEDLCTTAEARKSLHGWQQSYARQVGQEELLPKRGTMGGQGWMDRLLRRSSHDAGKRASIPGIGF